MVEFTVEKVEDTPQIQYILRWSYPDKDSKQIRVSEDTYKAMENYFKPKKQKKKPADAPTLDEVKQYFKQEGYTEDTAIRFYKYYSSMDWYDNNGKPVLRWKSKAISTWFKPDNKLKEETKSTNKPSFFQ